jgi:hypothetical protein
MYTILKVTKRISRHYAVVFRHHLCPQIYVLLHKETVVHYFMGEERLAKMIQWIH